MTISTSRTNRYISAWETTRARICVLQPAFWSSINTLFTNPLLQAEYASVWVENGTSLDGEAAAIAATLTTCHFNVAGYSQAASDAHAHTTIIVNTAASPAPYTTRLLRQMFGVRLLSENLPAIDAQGLVCSVATWHRSKSPQAARCRSESGYLFARDAQARRAQLVQIQGAHGAHDAGREQIRHLDAVVVISAIKMIARHAQATWLAKRGRSPLESPAVPSPSSVSTAPLKDRSA